MLFRCFNCPAAFSDEFLPNGFEPVDTSQVSKVCVSVCVCVCMHACVFACVCYITYNELTLELIPSLKTTLNPKTRILTTRCILCSISRRP